MIENMKKVWYQMHKERLHLHL